MKHFLLLALLALSTTTYSQITRGGGGAFTIGMQMLPVDELLQFHPEAPKMSTSNIWLGGYGYFQFNRFIVGMKGGGFYGSEQTDVNYSYRMGGGMFAVDLGYKVLHTESYSLYPVLGIGGGGIGYSISDRADVTLGSDNTPILNEASYNYGSVLFDIGARFEKSFGYESGDCGAGGGMVGLELGYMFSPSKDKWTTSSGASVINAPDYSMNGFYIRLLIGGFGGG